MSLASVRLPRNLAAPRKQRPGIALSTSCMLMTSRLLTQGEMRMKDSTEIVSASRRKFLKTTAAAASTAFSFTIVPRHVLGGQGQTPPSERLNMAGIGCGGMGGGDIGIFTKFGANFVALADVDDARAATRSSKASSASVRPSSSP